jgi:ABC-type Fe3+/spermidine/putrescine transport system ATPase subunit
MEDIILKNVSKRFGKTLAVDHVTLTIKAGSLFFLLGPSGCGKTTLLRMIAGFCDIEDGDILFGARSLREVAPGKRNATLVFQNYALWPHLNVHDNVAFGLKERDVPRSDQRLQVREALRGVRMEDYEFRKPNELSGGQQQRVALARALVVKPDAVLLDEPLSNLDAKLRLEMRQEIRRIHDETGVTMIYVTHDQKEALTMADQIAVMSMGRVEQIGPPQAIYHSPANIFVATFIGEANLIPGELIATADRHGTIRTSLGLFEGRLANEQMQTGDAVCCLVRPEKLSLTGAGENRMTVIVDNILFLGESEQYILQAGNSRLKALTIGAPAGIRKGDQTQVSFGIEDALLLPAERGGA